MPKNSKQLFITRTEGEWEIIKKKLCTDKFKEKQPLTQLSFYIRKEVLKVKNKLTTVPEEFTEISGNLVSIRPHIPMPIYEDIKRIAITLGVSENIIIDRLIITPLLNR